ncbi:hypothetical protein H6P81_021583 [Aristolochia fimbriata]|uniref:Uncharacterized protein n=1 Tax=Aristolochia fimbriata TaxID=158543 RepID=A0AAV7DT92_ARIFI|nr:hypothetical protein H6P81_021583 [Aristolochia fimbriata]
MDWCGSSTPGTPEYRTMNQERHERKAYWLVVRPQFLTGKDTQTPLPPSLWDGRAVGFHVVKELNNENRWRVPDRIDRVMGREPSLCLAVTTGALGVRWEALILGWAYYLDAFSSYPLRTWLPSVYRGHDNWYTRGQSPSGPRKPLRLRYLLGGLRPHRNCLPETVPWPVGPDTRKGPKPIPGNSKSFIGSFCPGAGSPHLHRHVYFTESLSETVPRSLRLSCGSGTYRQGFRYLRTVIVTAAVHRGFGRRLPVIRSPTSLTFRHWAGVSPHTWSYDFAETCVLVPFVEGRSSFSWEYGMGYFSAVAPGTRTLARGIFSTPSYPALKKASLLRPSGPTRGSTGIFTCCPSTTPFGLILGPDSPSVDEPCGGTLRFSGHWILTNVCVTQADILASASSTPARAGAFPKAERSPTDAFLHPTASADRLAPFIFGARALDQLAFATAPVGSLNQATAYESPAHSSTGTRSEINSLLPLLGSSRFHVLFHSPMGFFSPFPHGTTSLSVTRGYLALQGGPCGFTRDSTCPMLLGSGAVPISLAATTGIAFCFLFLWLLRCFQFARLSLALPMDSAAVRRLTYSGISGSMLIFNSPKHFVACYALPRLWVPRYPP